MSLLTPLAAARAPEAQAGPTVAGQHPSEVEADRTARLLTRPSGGRANLVARARPSARVAAGTGAPLDAATRTWHEARFGHDFRHVRVHTGEDSAASARAVAARAYTVGSDIVFGRGEFAPDTPAGRRLLAHELTHVAQNDGFGAEPAPGIARAPLPAAEPSPPVALHPEARAWLIERFDALVRSLSPEAYETLAGYKTLAVGLVSEPGDPVRLVFTTNQSSAGTELVAKARALGIEYWNPQPEVGGRGDVVGAPGDAEQLMIQYARSQKITIDAMVVSRELCPDCQIVVRGYQKGRITVIEIPLPKEGPPLIPGGAAGPTPGTEAVGPPAQQLEAEIQADLQIKKSAPAAGDQVVSELEVKLGSGLEPINQAIAGQGGKGIPEQVVLRVVTDAAGKVIAVDSSTPGVPPEIAEALGRQSVAVVTSGGLRVSPAEGVGFGLTLLFAVKAGYDIGTAPAGQRGRVAARHAGGFVGGMATSYLICNVILGLPTAGWSLLICGLAAGVPGGMAGSAAADVIYEEATINDTEIRSWVTAHDLGTIGGLPALTKAGYIRTLMRGYVTDADIRAAEKICEAVATADEMRLLRTLLERPITDMRDIGYRTRVRVGLDRL